MLTMSKKLARITLPLVLLVASTFLYIGLLSHTVSAATVIPQSDDTCKKSQTNKFLGIIPVWYEYVKDYKKVPTPADQGQSTIQNQLDNGSCGIVHPDGTSPGVNLKDDAVAIGLAVIDMLLRTGALVAVAFIMMGGYKYISSQGEPKNIEAAMATIINAAIGLGIVVSATVIVAFIGATLKG